MRSLLWLVAFVALVGTGGIGISLIQNAPPWSEPPGFGARLQAYLNTHVAETVDDSPFPELRPRHYDEVPADHLVVVGQRGLQGKPCRSCGRR